MVQPARTDHAVRASLAITAAATVAMAFADDMLAYLAPARSPGYRAPGC